MSALPYWAASTHGGVTKKSVLLDFDGDHTLDVATIVDDDLRLYLAPDTIDGDYGNLLSGGVNDVCVLQGAGTDGRDALAVAMSDGLRVITIENASTGGVSALVTGGVSRIQSRDLVAGGAIDFFALNGAGTAVLSGNYLAGTIAGVGTIVTGYGVAFDLRMVEWDGAGSPEVALLRATGIRIYNLGGGYVQSISGSPKTIGVVNHHALGGRELVAWTYEDAATGNDFLRVNGLGYSTGQQPAINLGLANITSITTGDLTNDGYAEVYLTHDFAAAQVAFVNQSTSSATSSTFGASNYAIVTLGSWSSSQNGFVATGAIGDLDNDGDGDLYVPCDVAGVESRFVFRNPTVDENSLRVTLENTEYFLGSNVAVGFALDLPEGILEGADRAQVVLWRAEYPELFDVPGIQGYSAQRESLPIGDFHIDISQWTDGPNSFMVNPQLYFTMDYASGTATQGMNLVPGSPANDGWFCVDIQVRLYDSNGEAGVFTVYPTTITSLTSDSNYGDEIAAASPTTGAYTYSPRKKDGTTGGSQTGGSTTVQRPVNPYGGTPTPPSSP